MRRNFYQRHRSTLERFDSLLLKNPVLERGLVLAPVIVASYNYQNSLLLGFSFVIITFVTVLLSSFISKRIPYTIRSILYTLLACVVFIPTAFLMDRLFPGTVMRVGVFLPLLVANSLIVVKSESRFHKQDRGRMVLELFCSTLGFGMVIALVGILREWLGSGALFGRAIEGAFTIPAVLMPFSGFIILGFLAAAVKRLRLKLDPSLSGQEESAGRKEA